MSQRSEGAPSTQRHVKKTKIKLCTGTPTVMGQRHGAWAAFSVSRPLCQRRYRYRQTGGGVKTERADTVLCQLNST